MFTAIRLAAAMAAGLALPAAILAQSSTGFLPQYLAGLAPAERRASEAVLAQCSSHRASVEAGLAENNRYYTQQHHNFSAQFDSVSQGILYNVNNFARSTNAASELRRFLAETEETTRRIQANPGAFLPSHLPVSNYRACITQARLAQIQGGSSPSRSSSNTARPQPPAPANASVNVRNVGLYGTRCVRASIRNVRRPAEANPHPTSWVGDWVLTNSCPLPQWVRIEVQGATLSWSGGLHHPGARMQPSPRLVPALWFTPINEIDFELHWLVPANGELVNPNPVIHQAVQEGMDVWIASCDAVGPQERQAIYLSARLPRGPEVACYNHGLPDGGLIAALDRAIQRNPQDVRAYFLRGWTYNRQGNHARAIADYDQVIRINPQDWSAFNNRGRAYQAQGNNARAFADFDEAIRLNPRVWNAFFNRGRLYQNQRDYARAVADLDEAVRLNPTNAFAYENRGFARARLNDRVRAAADYRAAARLEPGNAGIQNGVCWNMVVAGEDLAVARAACDAALRIAPGNAGYLDSRGLVGLKQGRFQEAWSDYDAALRAEDNNAHYRYGRGVAALRLGREAEGRADIAAATARDPAIAENYRSYGIIP